MSKDKDLDLLLEYERLIADGGYDYKPVAIEEYKYYNCATGVHKWKWYVGFHMDRFWYCEMCPAKDLAGPPPSRS